jgi:hypothetical protein
MTDNNDFDDVDDENGIDILKVPSIIQKAYDDRYALLNELYNLNEDSVHKQNEDSDDHLRIKDLLFHIDKKINKYNEETDSDAHKGHDMGSFRKVMKQFKKCPDIIDIIKKKSGVLIVAKNGETLSMHSGSVGRYVILRDWVKKNTSMSHLRI